MTTDDIRHRWSNHTTHSCLPIHGILHGDKFSKHWDELLKHKRAVAVGVVLVKQRSHPLRRHLPLQRRKTLLQHGQGHPSCISRQRLECLLEDGKVTA
jgi:hypothetical protein